MFGNFLLSLEAPTAAPDMPGEHAVHVFANG